MVAIFVLLLVSVFHGYVSGYPTKGMLKIFSFFLFRGINRGSISYYRSR